MNEKPTKSKLKLHTTEIVFYSISAVLMLWGLAECGLGIAQTLTPHNAKFYSACVKFQSLFGLPFIGWGLLLIGFGVIISVTVLCIYAKSNDREFEKAQRRAARLSSIKKDEPEVVDAKIEETK